MHQSTIENVLCKEHLHQRTALMQTFWAHLLWHLMLMSFWAMDTWSLLDWSVTY